MNLYEGKSIRNVGIVGHSGSGKTSLISAALFDTGATNRLGRVDDGNAPTDYDEDEIERKITIGAKLAFCEWNKTKINMLDTPGFGNFIQEARGALRVADAALVAVDAVAGVMVQTEKVWSYADEFGLPRMILINRMDRETASFERSIESIQQRLGRACVPIQVPIGAEKKFKGVVDLIQKKAYVFAADGTGKFMESAIPDDIAVVAEEYREKLIEAVAESDEKLMEKFFDSGTLPDEDIVAGLRKQVSEGKIYPVLFSSATANIGIAQLLNAIVNYLPDAVSRGTVTGKDSRGADVERKIADSEPFSAFVFKTFSDPFTGRISLFRIYSGVLTAETQPFSVTKGVTERFGQIATLQGKTLVTTTKLHAGDIGAAPKLKETVTGDTLSDKTHQITYPAVKWVEPVISFAIEPKSRGDEDKISSAIHKLMDEDLGLGYSREVQTKEFLLSGQGQMHVELAVARLKKRYGVEVLLHPPKVPYRETIKGKADVQGKHKKQSGGHGQYGDCKIRMEPLPRGGDFEFVNEVFGGAIPRNYIPAVEKGIQEARIKGVLAGFPTVDFRVILYDGSYHDVDSSEMAFKIAGSLAFKKAIREAKPILLEPVMNVEVNAPEEFAGDLMGDLNSRRGRVQGMDVQGRNTVIKAQVPLSEVLSYASDLTSKTGARGSYTMEFSHYDEVPSQLAEKIIAHAKAGASGEAEDEES
ncbi:MAG TPA: elongation factor G [Terriglobia bacterium]|nr:elongation factor G [Terriglobia bacterium]